MNNPIRTKRQEILNAFTQSLDRFEAAFDSDTDRPTLPTDGVISMGVTLAPTPDGGVRVKNHWADVKHRDGEHLRRLADIYASFEQQGGRVLELHLSPKDTGELPVRSGEKLWGALVVLDPAMNDGLFKLRVILKPPIAVFTDQLFSWA